MRWTLKALGVIGVMVAVAIPGVALARKGKIQAGGGVGLALNPPVRFDLQLNGEYFLLEDLSVGLNVDFLFRGATTIGFFGVGRYHFDIGRLPRLVPYVGGGIGGLVTTNGNGFFDLMLPDFGFKWELLANRLFVGPDVSVHLVTNGDNTDWDLRFLFAIASYRF